MSFGGCCAQLSSKLEGFMPRLAFSGQSLEICGLNWLDKVTEAFLEGNISW